MKNRVTLYRTVKTDDQEEANSDPRDSITEPIRESVVLFVIKIATILIITDLVYAVVNFVLLRAFFLNHELPFNIHDLTAYILTLLHIAKTALQVWGISSIVFRWVGNSYFITQKHLVRHEGIINCIEKIYDLDIIRSISIQQSWLGKIFRYGSVNIEISASGGYTDQVTLNGVTNPQQYEKMLRRHF
ncbi:PH domain-containing protein [Candidatus Daviesbacteria bacterium]|nr:PH domain-containing protein [Candidatus Daviesbacteria bacterium]